MGTIPTGRNYLWRALALGVFGFSLLGFGVHRVLFRTELLLVPLLFGTLFLVVALVNLRIYVSQQQAQKTK